MHIIIYYIVHNIMNTLFVNELANRLFCEQSYNNYKRMDGEK